MGTETDYYSNVRSDFFHYLEKGRDSVVLELGCAEGRTGAALKREGYASYVVGLDVHAPSVEVAKGNLDEAQCADLDLFDLGSLGSERFDYVICGDVLEHLRDPWAVISKLQGLIKPSGMLLITLPNTQHYSVSASLLFAGEWRYQDAGILDRTHIRFFTKKSMLRMFDPTQFDLVTCNPLFWGKRDSLINRLTLRLFENILAPQWTMVLRRK